ncbi:ethanolamine ammonia-lyase light chain [Bryobacterales bacterium F-183]|nr:ethanolamine ammonia-lyase light chain [Bryobacterales bacterium F-183]
MPARIGLGLAGHGLPTRALLDFQLDHARARDAVHQDLARPFPVSPHIELHSAAANRAEYLRRPDLGRKLSASSAGRLERGDYDVAFVLCDGLSPTAVTRHAAGLLDEITPRLKGWKIAPLTVVLQGRVAVGDEVAMRLGARMVAVLIGERPGLTSPDSLGVYLTWNPKPGVTTDADRNCISNVRTEGLSYSLAAHKLHYLMEEARRRELTGVQLKEDAAGERTLP